MHNFILSLDWWYVVLWISGVLTLLIIRGFMREVKYDSWNFTCGDGAMEFWYIVLWFICIPGSLVINLFLMGFDGIEEFGRYIGREYRSFKENSDENEG